MSSTSETTPAAPPAAHPSLRVLGVYAASRVLTTAILLACFLLAPTLRLPFGSARAATGFLHFLAAWDGTAYRQIALHGYPTTLPVDAAGHVLPNAWAFLPLYPALVRAIMAATGSGSADSFDIVAVLVSLLAGAGAAVVLHRLLQRTTTPCAALWGTVLFCVGPLSFVLQVAYAESLFLLLLFGALLALRADRLLPFTLLAVAASATRPGALVLGVALLVHSVMGWRDERRRSGRSPAGSRVVSVLLSGATIGAAGLAWPVIAGAVTGHPDAYVQTELAWWTGYVGRPGLVPFAPWLLMATRYLGPLGVVLVVAVWGLAVVLLTRRAVRALGPEVLGFSVAHLAYLAAVFLPQQSLPRLLLPLAPVLGAAPLSETPRRRGLLLGIAVALQIPAVLLLWVIGYP